MKQEFCFEVETEWKLDLCATKQALELVRFLYKGKSYLNWLNRYSFIDMCCQCEQRGK